MAFPNPGPVGAYLDGEETRITQLGLECFDNQGRKRRLVSSASAITAGDVLLITGANSASPITPTIAINAGLVGFTPTTFSASTSGQYFWAMLDGPVAFRVAANCQPNVPLYTTDTAGVLDDLTVSLSQYQIMGVEVDTGLSNSAAGVSVLSGAANNPLVRHPRQGP